MSNNRKRSISPGSQGEKGPFFASKAKGKVGSGSPTNAHDTKNIISAEAAEAASNQNKLNTMTSRKAKDGVQAGPTYPAYSGRGNFRKFAKVVKKSKTGKTKSEFNNKQVSSFPADESDLREAPELQNTEPETNSEKAELVESGPSPSGVVESVEIDQQQQEAATKIQALYRGYAARKRFVLRLKNIIKVQSFARAFLARRRASTSQAKQESIVKASALEIEESSAPKIEESAAPEIEDSPAPEIEDSPAPEIEESPVPEVEESPAPEIEDSPAVACKIKDI